MLLQVKGYSTALRHGASPIKDSVETSLTIKKSKDVIGSRDKTNRSSGQAKAESHKYGEHSGSVQVFPILEIEGNADELNKAIDELAPVINTFRNLPAIDLRAMKKEYGDFLDDMSREYDKKYGRILNSEQTVEFTNRCAKKAFRYYRHQIVLKFIGRLEEFKDQDRLTLYSDKDGVQLFVTEIKVKSVFTMELLTQVQVSAILNGSDKTVKATSRDIAFQMELQTTNYGVKYVKVPKEELDDDDPN